MRRQLYIIIMLLLGIQSFGQETEVAFKEAIRKAEKFYDEALYDEAAQAYSIAFSLNQKNEIPRHYLFAAASNCMIDNEEGVRQNLFAILPICTKDDIKKVLVNYKIFDKYKQKEWWKILNQKMDQRLADLIAHHQNLKVFRKGRNIHYKAIRINESGDTLANTTIVMKPDGTGWGDIAASLQSQVIFEYHYSPEDSLEHISELIEVVTADFWIQNDTTGVIENEEKIWMHPFRNNEFFKIELAPFPKVVFPISKETMEAANSKIYILRNWGTYSGSYTENEYTYLGKEPKTYESVGEIECFKLKAQSFNNFHGISKIEYYFNADLGFVEMHYETYDHEIIHFVMDKVELIETE